jgi:hypothetical protein
MSGQLPASNLAPALDTLAATGGRWLWKSHLRDGLRARMPKTLALLLLAPAVALAVIGLGWIFGQPWKLPLLPLAVLCPVPSLLYLGLQCVHLGRKRPGRRAGLAVFDEMLGLKDRLQTADEFLVHPHRTAFMEAAIEDAGPALETAGQNPPEWQWKEAPGKLLRWAVAPVLAVLLLVIAGFLPAASRNGADPAPSADERPAWAGKPPVIPTTRPPAPAPAAVETNSPEAKRPQEPVRKATAGDPVPAKIRETPAPDLAARDKTSQGNSQGGQTSQAAAAGRSSQSQGMAGSQAPASSPDAPREASKKESKPGEEKPAENEPRKVEDPSGATPGRGSSGGSSRNPAATDWAGKDRTEPGDSEEFNGEENVDDEDSESAARGGLQPNLRDRRSPVNRDLGIGFGNTVTDDANGRGGPGERKKSRGVAGLVLGVPVPDQVKGQPNPGRVKVTQERIQPQAEDLPSAAAEDRGRRSSPAGHLSERTLDKSMRETVRSYFLRIREEGDAPP